MWPWIELGGLVFWIIFAIMLVTEFIVVRLDEFAPTLVPVGLFLAMTAVFTSFIHKDGDGFKLTNID